MRKFCKSIVATLTIFLFIAASLTGSAYNVELTEETVDDDTYLVSLGPHIIIPDHFLTIQEGIDNANSGEVIFVRSGIYNENILVDKEGLTIMGENKFTTVVDGGKTTDDAMNVSASNVAIHGFTFTNALNSPNSFDVSGLRINSLNIVVTDNIFTSNGLGVSVMPYAYNSTISNNIFIDDGIFLGQYQVSDFMSKQDFLHTIEDNTVNSKPLYYYKDIQDFVVPNDAGQVILANCSNVTIKDLYLSKTDFSVILAYCDNCTIENLTVMDTDGEVILFKSDNNLIQNNKMVNHLHGICLDYKSNSNIVRNNYVAKSLVGISAVTSSSNNLIINNTVEENFAGIHISAFCDPGQHDNRILNNTITNNDIGINLLDNSYENIIENNTVKSCKIGIRLKNSSNNIFKNNILKKNKIPAIFFDCDKNIWNNNYWNRPRILPKIIFGYRSIGNLPVPWLNIDQHPSRDRNIN